MLLWAGVAAVVLAVVILLYATAPDLYPNPAVPGDPPEVAAARNAAHTQAVVTTRASVLAALAGAGALFTIIINYRNSRTQARAAEAQGRAAEAQARAAEIAARGQEVAVRALEVTQQTFLVTERGHLTDRYTRAIEQLGDTGGEGSITIRLGGIYALQQVAVDTTRDSDQAAVVEVLSAFVRINLRAEPTESCTDSGLDDDPGPDDESRTTSALRPQTREPRADVLAAFSTLAQLPAREGAPIRADFTSLDFTGISLVRARLTGANLAGAHLHGADLTGADLSGADLHGASLVGARLTDANLEGADLTGADLSGADLDGADLPGARLPGAGLIDTNLSGADLRDVNLARARLVGARLRRANLGGANLRGADLRGADLLEADLSGADLTDADLRGGRITPIRCGGRAGVHTFFPSRRVRIEEIDWADDHSRVLAPADLTDACLRGACLHGARLKGACFLEADVTDADFSNTDLIEARLGYNTNIIGAHLDTVTEQQLERRQGLYGGSSTTEPSPGDVEER